MWAEKNNRAIKFFTARPNGILRGGVGSRNRRRPLKPLEGRPGWCKKLGKWTGPHAMTLNKYTEPTPPLKIPLGQAVKNLIARFFFRTTFPVHFF